ncbi:unnamed protein product [Amoebophrya sp. A120]|nr:unnamed protein product [Amoebophrya sp. A120]|eukprot:GSA120T00019411001.1
MLSVMQGNTASQLARAVNQQSATTSRPMMQSLRFFSAKIKPMRDPARPSPPMTPYFMYLAQWRKSAPADVKGKDAAKVAAQQWKALPEAEKAPFLQTYEQKKATYDAAFREYKESGKLDAWKRDPEKPKKPLTGFMRYSMEWRKSNGAGLKATEVTKKAAAAWKELPADKRAAYDGAYKTEKESYDVAMKNYKSSGKEAAFKEKTGIAAKEKQAAEKKMKMKMRTMAMKTKTRMQKKKMQMKMRAQKMKMKMQAMKKKKMMRAMKMKEKSKMRMKKMKVAKAQRELKALNSQAKKLTMLVRRADKMSMKMKKMQKK